MAGGAEARSAFYKENGLLTQHSKDSKDDKDSKDTKSTQKKRTPGEFPRPWCP